ncbi:MAG: 4Fe-4S binding protein [Eggerthellaceae bacterium]|nr:4Fe-4S binding protein [Eggerthellaceae bacterium]
MPSLENIVQVAEALEKSPVIVMRDRCVAVRNRNATCRTCASSCPEGAIDVGLNEVKLEAGKCIACGICVSACPTEALVAVQPTEGGLREASLNSVKRNDGCAIVACARIAAKRQADPARYAEVPCLSFVDEALIIELASKGAERLLLVDGNCTTCKHQRCIDALEGSLRLAAGLLEAHGSSAVVDRVTGFPDALRVEDAQGLHGSTRRGFFSDAVGAAKETAMTAARTTLENELGYKIDEASIGDRLRVTEKGTLPQLRMPRHEAVLNALDAIGLPQEGAIESRLFGSVSIDVEKCNSCGMCAVFCPTGALARDDAEKASDPLRYLEFSAADCVQCGLCEDVCWKEALTLSRIVDASELYDFEPRTFKLRAPKKKSFTR